MQAHSDSDESFFERVRAVVAQIPVGRVTTYGDIAEHLGRRGAARIVGWA
ncbi:alkylated DNA nucleotide flippase Atl1, partial [Salinibacter ruber]|nr:alkylated DNA nucleotide flippase Atl1 [Salinibacter ruber]